MEKDTVYCDNCGEPMMIAEVSGIYNKLECFFCHNTYSSRDSNYSVRIRRGQEKHDQKPIEERIIT